MKLVSQTTLLVNLGTLCAVIALAESSTVNVRRWGPRYCQSLCTAGCSSNPGNIVEHRCHRSQTKSSQTREDKDDHSFQVTKEVVTKNAENTKVCSETFTVVQGEESTRKCIKGFTRPNPSGKMSRLLFTGTRGEFYQMNLNNQRVVKYPYLISSNSKRYPKGLMVIAFIPLQNKLVLYFGRPKGLYLSPLDSNTLIPIEHKLANYIAKIVVDEEHKLVFMTSHVPEVRVKVMTTRGTELKVAFTPPRGCSIMAGIAVDPKQSHIFLVYSQKSIDMFTYRGKLIKHVVVGAIDGPLLFDCVRNVLYYSIELNIHKFTLQSNKSKLIVKLSAATKYKTLYNFALDKTNLYVSKYRSAGLFVVDRFSVVKEIKADKILRPVILCLVT